MRKKTYPNKNLTLIFIFLQLTLLSVSSCMVDPPASKVEKQGAISGVVVNSVSIVPLSGATVTTTPSTSVVKTDTSGRFVFSNITPGKYIVTAALAGYDSNSIEVVVVSEAIATGDLALLEHTGSITGVVADSATGQPLIGATIHTIPETKIILTDSFGKYKLADIPISNYTVNAELAGFEIQSQNFTLQKDDVIQWNPVLKRLNFLGNQFMYVPGGTFQMGDIFNEGEDHEKPVHTVNLPGFYISKTEITFEQYDKFCDSTGRSKPSDNGWGRGTRPVINVSWQDAVAFCEWASTKFGRVVRLPTEAEWEYAARGGGKNTRYSGTNSLSYLRDYAWYASNSFSRPNPVGQKLPNSLGLCDMTGNVWEWCSDWYADTYYMFSPLNSPQGPEMGIYKVIRGGSWINGVEYLRVTYRGGISPTTNGSCGFRIVVIP